MNPGGNLGKKELPAALRNSFTEIRCPTPSQDSHEFEIICSDHSCQVHAPSITPLLKTICKETMNAFLSWLSRQQFFSKKSLTSGKISICFISDTVISPVLALIHGVHLGFVDDLNVESERRSDLQ